MSNNFSLFCFILKIFLVYGFIDIEDVEPVTSTNKSVIIYKAQNHGLIVQYDMEVIRKLNQFIVSIVLFCFCHEAILVTLKNKI